MVPEHVTLADGTTILIRPVQPEDRSLIADAVERLSPESRYRRFFKPVTRLTSRQLDYLSNVDHHDHEALIAIDIASGWLIGVARYVRTGPQAAEPAIVVNDDWHGRGVATTLLERLVAHARSAGIVRFKAAVLAENIEAITVLGRLGDTTMQRRGREVELEIALEPRAEPVPRAHSLMRALASGTVDPVLTVWQRLTAGHGDDDPDAARANVIVTAVEDVAEVDSPAAAVVQDVASAGRSELVVVAARHALVEDRAAADKRARQVAARLRSQGLDARQEIRSGDLAAIILDVAVEERARMIIVGDARDGDPAGRFLGERWDHISHHAPCSVLVARG